jgi:multidrug efflux pump subunit AcrB
MVVVCTSIPLAIFSAIIGLKLSGHTINIMTLGGLALAIGMLVDDATVEVENIHRNRSLGKPLTVAILDGASQIAVPAIVATLAICIVFFPVVLLVGPARFLFTPLALAVVLAMLASYLLSRTLVPTLSRFLMEHEHHPGAEQPPHPQKAWKRLAARMNQARDRGFEHFQNFYASILQLVLAHRSFTLTAGAIFLATSVVLVFIVGLDFFPSVDTGLMKLHFRAPVGTRIEETEKMVAALEQRIRSIRYRDSRRDHPRQRVGDRYPTGCKPQPQRI